MGKKYYRVLKDTPAWVKGAIIEQHPDNSKKYQVTSDIWLTEAGENTKDYWECDSIVEESPDWYERVYEINILGKVSYATKEIAKQTAAKIFKEK